MVETEKPKSNNKQPTSEAENLMNDFECRMSDDFQIAEICLRAVFKMH